MPEKGQEADTDVPWFARKGTSRWRGTGSRASAARSQLIRHASMMNNGSEGSRWSVRARTRRRRRARGLGGRREQGGRSHGWRGEDASADASVA